MLRRSRGVPAPRHARPCPLPGRLSLTAAGTALGSLVLPLALTATAAPAFAAQQHSATRLSAPASAAPGRVPVTVRLLSDGSHVSNGVVDVQVPSGAGWRTVAQAATDGQGIGRVAVTLRADQRLRAHYRGSSVRTPATSAVVTVEVRSAASEVVEEASRHRGKPYRYGATGPSAFDCSGFTRYVYSRFGKSLPHSSRAQEDLATPVSRSQARPGDLVFIQDVAGHVGIYAGNGRMWDAPRSGRTVQLREIWTSNYTVGRV